MKLSKILFMVFIVVLIPALNNYSQPISRLIDEGDRYYKQFNNEKALEVFKKAEKIDATNFELLWRLSRTYVELAEKMPTENGDQKDAQLVVYQKGLEYAEKAVNKDPNSSATEVDFAVSGYNFGTYSSGISKVEFIDVDNYPITTD